MNVELCYEPFEYIIIDDTYTPDELKLIFLELDFLNFSNYFFGPERTGSAFNKDGSPKKQNRGIFLDEVYQDRNTSNILKFNRRLFELELGVPNIINRQLRRTNNDSTLISYYENSDHYLPHSDKAHITSLTYIYREPKCFEGGELLLTDYGYVFEPLFNRTYIFPSAVTHEVTKIIMKKEDCKKGLGRYCISNFANYFSDKEK